MNIEYSQTMVRKPSELHGMAFGQGSLNTSRFGLFCMEIVEVITRFIVNLLT